jgi:hypothetical protein
MVNKLTIKELLTLAIFAPPTCTPEMPGCDPEQAACCVLTASDACDGIATPADTARPDHPTTAIVEKPVPTASIRLALTLAGVAAGATCADAQVLMERNVSMAMARAIVEGAMEQCRKDGHRVVVVVVDRAGQMAAMLRDDGTNPHNFELARRKAYTSRTFRQTTVSDVFRPPA